MGRVNPNQRGKASRFFIAGELCRRGLAASVTLGGAPNTDILCSNREKTKSVHIKVRTYLPDKPTCIVGPNAENDYGTNFVWVLGGIPKPNSNQNPEYYIIPSSEMARKVTYAHQQWLQGTKPNGDKRNDNPALTVHLPPKTNYVGWSIQSYKNRWDIIGQLLKD